MENTKDDFKQLVNDIFNKINRTNYIYLIQLTDHSSTSGLYDVTNGYASYSNDTVEIFKLFSKNLRDILQVKGVLLIYPNEYNKPETKFIQFYNPELFTNDLFELLIFQEFDFQPKDEERQMVLKQSILKEKIKDSLVYSCYENNTARILEILKDVKKSQLDKKLEYTGTPLGLCVINKNIDCFKAIAESGADVSKKSLAYTPLQLAFKYSYEIVKYIYSNFRDVFEKEAQKQGFYIAADSMDINALNLMKDFGADLNKFDPYFPHLHNFADRNNIIGIEFCLNNGIDINMKDKQGRSALDKAILRNHKEAIDYLRDKGAKESEK
jgi:ankyrin repeat protein